MPLRGPMLSLELDSLFLNLRGTTPETLKVIDSVTSYMIQGAWFAKSFRDKTWDGKQHLLSYSRTNGYRVHAGCTADVVAALRNEGVKFSFVDLRKPPEPSCDHGWTGIILTPQGVQELKPRQYQVDAAKAVLTESFPLGRCMVKLPIRTGKTVLGGLIIGALNVPTLFIVTSDLLLEQTVKLYRSMFTTEIGVIGAGVWDIQDITVATIQSLYSKAGTPEYANLMNRTDLAIFDECHHYKGSKKLVTSQKQAKGNWKDVVVKCPAYYKVGLSATIYIDITKPTERENIWLKASTGNICYEVTTKRMIEEGWLLRPVIEMYHVRGPSLQGDWASDEIYQRGIARYMRRNERVVELAIEAVSQGASVMVMARLHEHIDALYDALDARGVAVEKLTGRVTGQPRHAVLRRFRKGQIKVLVGNVFGEGLDVPEVDVVIVAEGGESRKKTIQRMRNLTPSPGKGRVRVVDFLDEHEAHLARHAKARLDAYRQEDAFEILVL
jgi:superfamily II DNA or RNA helicase